MRGTASRCARRTRSRPRELERRRARVQPDQAVPEAGGPRHRGVDRARAQQRVAEARGELDRVAHGEKAPHDGLLSSGANFGIVDTSTDTSKLRATFRRMHAGGLFEQPGRELESAEETATAMAMARAPALGEQSDEYVLVSTDRLRELAVLERTLRQERSVLATQCG